MTWPNRVAPSRIPVPCVVCQQRTECCGCWCDGFVCLGCLETHLAVCAWAKAKRHALWHEKKKKGQAA